MVWNKTDYYPMHASAQWVYSVWFVCQYVCLFLDMSSSYLLKGVRNISLYMPHEEAAKTDISLFGFDENSFNLGALSLKQFILWAIEVRPAYTSSCYAY